MIQSASVAKAKVATLEARLEEIEKRAGDLKTELCQAHANADQARRTAADRAGADQAQLAHLNDALMRRMEADAVAREEVARLRGQLELMDEERQALLIALKPNGVSSAPSARPTSPKKTRPDAS
jgi:colicin import membrane protein